MPALVVLRNLSYATPDGRPLLDGLDIAFGAERTGLIGRNGAGKSTLLRLMGGDLAPASGAVLREGRIGMLRQGLLPDPGETVAQAFGAAEGLARVERLSAGRGSLEDAAEADWTLHERIADALAGLGLPGLDPFRPLASLSGGQRMRVQLAALLFRQPDMILLDEPTNDLDREGREAVAAMLAGWRGGAVVASHDRGLLRGMDRILELSTLGARLHGGNWDHYLELKALEREAAGHRLAAAERRVREIDAKTRAARERQSRRDGRGRRERARGGQAKILLDAKKETSERSAARTDLLAGRMRREAAEAAMAARAEVERLESVRVALAPSGLAPGRVVLALRDVSGGPDGRTAVSGVSFTICGPERVAVTGPNGSGKTSLLRLAAGDLEPAAGEVRRSGRSAMLDQQAALLKPELSIAANFRRLNPGDGENACRAALARFLFRADAALRLVGELSGGETLRAGLACVLGGRRPPGLLLLDEPTNHLDLDAVAAVEAGLSAYDGALLVASHDEAFLEAIGITRRIGL